MVTLWTLLYKTIICINTYFNFSLTSMYLCTPMLFIQVELHVVCHGFLGWEHLVAVITLVFPRLAMPGLRQENQIIPLNLVCKTGYPEPAGLYFWGYLLNLLAPAQFIILTKLLYTVCLRSSDPFYVVIYYIKWVTTSWTYTYVLEWPILWSKLAILCVQEVVTYFIK